MLSPKKAAQPNPSYPAIGRQDHISMEHRLWRKHLLLNIDTNVAKEEEQDPRKRKRKRNRKRRKKKKKEEKKKGRKKKEKRLQRGTSRDGPKIFFFRNVTRNRNEIQAQQKIRF